MKTIEEILKLDKKSFLKPSSDFLIWRIANKPKN